MRGGVIRLSFLRSVCPMVIVAEMLITGGQIAKGEKTLEDNMTLWPGGPVFRQAEHMKITTDAVLLADFVNAAGGRGVDLGCASGILMLLILERQPGLKMTGLEIISDAADVAKENLRENGLSERGLVVCGDMRVTGLEFEAGSFDFVVFNPPYYGISRGTLSPDPERAFARSETEADLEDFCRLSMRLCRSGGKIFCCYKPERMTELFELLSRYRMEPKRLRFVYEREDCRANLILLEARRDGNRGLRVEAPLILKNAEGKETEEYLRIYHRRGAED